MRQCSTRYSTGSPAVAERPRGVSCLSASIVQYVHRNVLLLVTSASDLPLRVIEFCSLLFFSAYSLMHGGFCRKQTCTVTVIHHCTDDRQLFIALQQSSIDSQLFVQNRDLCLPHLHLTPPLRRRSRRNNCHDVWYRKTRMVWLPDSEKIRRYDYSF